MSARWIYDMKGKPSFYQHGENVFSPDGKHAFYVSEGWWYAAPNWKAAYYLSGAVLYTPNGKAAFYFGNEQPPPKGADD